MRLTGFDSKNLLSYHIEEKALIFIKIQRDLVIAKRPGIISRNMYRLIKFNPD